MKSSTATLLHGLLLVACLFTASVAVRRQVLTLQTQAVEGEVPFVLEAGLQYRMTRMVYEDGAMPERDAKVQVPEGIEPAKIYSLGAEWVYAGLARWLPESMSLHDRIRWASVLLFCVSVPVFALWAGLRWQSWLAAWATGIVLAVSPAFAVRSTGLALSRENLAFPFMALFLLFEVLAHRSGTTRKTLGWSALAAGAIALGQVFWDLTQYLIGLWVLKEWWACIRGKRLQAIATRVMPAAVVVGLLIASVTNPYMRSHGYYASPWISMLLGLLLANEVGRLRVGKRWVGIGSGLLLAVLWKNLLPVPAGSYNHFGELLWAKIRFLNQKPADPSQLNFLQRIMWTPALNSATFALTKAYIPVFVPLFVLSAPLVWMRSRSERSSRLIHPLVYAGITLAAYVLFFRFHVFLIVFSAFGIGGLAAWFGRRSSGILRMSGLALLMVAAGVETKKLLFFDDQIATSVPDGQADALKAFQSLGMKVETPKFNAWGHPDVIYPDLQGLTDWLSEQTDQEPVLASFGVSGSILAYAGNPILLHPKFETAEIRDRVEQYGEMLFKHDEAAFRRWALDLGAVWYVHGNGSFSDAQPTLSLRYMVDAMEPGPVVAARTLEQSPMEAIWFRQVYSNARYRVFRIVSDEDEEFAATMTEMAINDARAGELEKALERARQALRYHWKYEPAQELVKTLIAEQARRR